MGQLEKYGLYVLCLVIFLILGVAIWGGEPEASGQPNERLPNERLPNESLPLHGTADGANNTGGGAGPPAPRYSSAADVIQTLLEPSDPPARQGRNLPPRPEPKRELASAPPAEDRGERTPAGRRVYTVKKNDILGTIAQRELGSSLHWKAILALNPGVDEKKLKPGQELILPARDSLVSEDPAAPPATAYRFHKVEKGESFYLISKKLYGTDRMMDEIQALNPRVDPLRLRAGMEIKVPIVR